jgi:FAD:protein FMN transferase
LNSVASDGLVRRARPLLGTIVEIAIPAELADKVDVAFEASFAAIADVHSSMSFHERDSDLGKIRRAMPGETIDLAPGTMTVLRAAIDLHRESGGIFDVAIGRHLVGAGLLPRDDIIHLSRFAGTMADIEIVDTSRIRLHKRLLVDLGGIAKGYAVDVAVAALVAAGVDYGIVNAGGDMRIFGDIAQPVTLQTGRGELIFAGTGLNCAIASSENTKSRKRIRGEIATPHVLSDGSWTIIDELISVTASSCMIADALTKVAMIDVALANRMLFPHGGRVIYSPQLMAIA